jgi:hypothetical protein
VNQDRDETEETPMTARWVGMCVAAQALFVTSAALSEPVSPASGNRSENVAVKQARPSGQVPAAPSIPAPVPNVRMVIATFLERNERFKKYDDDGAPKLINARIAGPTQLATMSPPQPIYCIQVDLIMTNRILWITHDPLQAALKFPPSENGKQRIEGKVWSLHHSPRASATCNHVPYTPFPELEQLRAQRRHALHKSDS